MAEGTGGVAAAFSFTELTQSVGRVSQSIRARLAPPDARSTWLGPSSELAEVLAGSVLRCTSSEAGSYWAVIPPRVPSVATVRRLRGVVTVRVSRDGSAMSARYEDLQSFHEIVLGVFPGILTMGGVQGELAHAVKLLTSGGPAKVLVSASTLPSSPARPMFTLASGVEVVIGPTPDFAAIARALSVTEVDWNDFAKGGWWGLPSTGVQPAPRPMQWAATSDALGIAAVFGPPSVSSNIDALQFLAGCCEPPSAWWNVEELSHAFTDEAPATERDAMARVLSQLSAITLSRPDVVDSVHSRLKAIMLAEDAPAPFVAFGRAWRQGSLEPPSRRASQPASPSLAVANRRASRSSPPHTPALSLEDELNVMSPNTMRQKLKAFLAAEHQGGAATQSAPAAATVVAAELSGPSIAPTSMRSPSHIRAQHSGQLGGLFGGDLTTATPSPTAASGAASRLTRLQHAQASMAAQSATPDPASVQGAPHVPSVESVIYTIKGRSALTQNDKYQRTCGMLSIPHRYTAPFSRDPHLARGRVNPSGHRDGLAGGHSVDGEVHGSSYEPVAVLSRVV